MTGVPGYIAEAKNFILVHPDLIRLLGGDVTAAVVWSRLDFRTRPESRDAVEHDGSLWFVSSLQALADDIGISFAVARRAVGKLVMGGFLEARKLRLGGNYDQTMSYRTLVEGEHPHLSPGTNQHVSPVTNVPSIKKSEEVPPYISPQDQALEHAFAQAWAHWPKKQKRKAALEQFVRAAKRRGSVEDLVRDISRFGLAFASYREKQFVPALDVWLRGDRWEDELPEPEARQQRGVETLMEKNLGYLRDTMQREALAEERGIEE